MSTGGYGTGNNIVANIANLRVRAEHLQQQAGDKDTQQGEADLQEAIEELYISLEELEVATDAQHEAEAHLREAYADVERERERYRDLFRHAPDGYVITNTAGVIQEANLAAAELLGIDEQYLTGKPLAIYVDAEDQRRFRSLLGSLRDGVPEGEQLMRIAPRSGEPFSAALTMHTDIGPRGGLTGIRWQIRDVTTRIRLAEEHAQLMREEAARTEAERGRLHVVETLERMTDAFLAVDRNWRVTYYNGGAHHLLRDLFQHVTSSLDDQHLRDLLGNYFFEQCERIWESGAPDSFELHYEVPDVWFNVRVFPGDDGLTMYFRDITDRMVGQDLVRQLSTPVVEIADRVLLLPLVGRVDAPRTREMTPVLLSVVREYRARVIVIDITGAVFAQLQDANVLVQTAQAMKLLGATTVLTGISVKTSIALTQIDVSLREIVTAGDLRTGIERALRIAAQGPAALPRSSQPTR